MKKLARVVVLILVLSTPSLVVTSVHNHALQIFIKCTDLVVFDEAPQVSNWNHVHFHYLVVRLLDTG